MDSPPPCVVVSAYDSGMQLSQEDVDAFAALWKQDFGEQLGPGEARIEATRFFELCWLLAQPLPGEPGHSSGSLTNL